MMMNKFNSQRLSLLPSSVNCVGRRSDGIIALHSSIRKTLLTRIVCIVTGGLICFSVSLHAQDSKPEQSQVTSSGNAQTQQPLQSVYEKPRWEVGVGGGYFWGYDYPASSDVNQRGIALPFFIYRTPSFRFGGSGIRAVAIERPRLKLDISVGGSLNASSDGNSARKDMPDLDFLFEVGPQLEMSLFDRPLASGGRFRGRFTSELRAVFSTDFSGIDARGFVAEFGVGMNVDNIGGTNIGLIASVDTTFASEDLQDFFYEVGEQYVTSTRPQYDAKGGYLESTLFTGLGFKPLRQVRVFAGVSTGFYNGARNRNSPLFEVNEQIRYLLGVVWTIKTSKDMVEIVELGTAE